MSWHDPEVGDELLLIPTRAAGAGIDQYHRYVDTEVLPATQGVVVKKLHPDVTVSLAESAIVIERPHKGLLLSENDVVSSEPSGTLTSLFDFSTPQHELQKTLIVLRREFDAQIASFKGSASHTPQEEVYLRYGKTLLMKNVFQEAQGIFLTATLNTQHRHQHPNQYWRLEAYRFLAALLAQDTRTAQSILKNITLAHDPELQFLSSLLDVKEGRMEKAKPFLKWAPLFLKQYPHNIKGSLGLMALEGSVTLKEYGLSAELLEILKQTPLDSAPMRDKLAYYQALFDLAHNNNVDSRKQLQALESSSNPQIRAKARLNAILEQLKTKKIPIQEAIQQLDQLRFTWRQGPEYREVIDTLVSLLFQQQDYTRALSVLRQSLDKSELPTEQHYYRQRISDSLMYVLTSPATKQAPILGVLGLFAEFKPFLDPRKDWPKVIYPLLDRLEAYDLLHPAIEILEDQLRNPFCYPDAPTKAKDQMRLASLFIRHDKPEQALPVLQSIDDKSLEEEKKHHLLAMKVQTLMQLQQFNAALNLLGESSVWDDMMRVTIYWRMADWTHVTTTLEKVLAHLTNASTLPEIPFNREELILMQAVALTLNEESEKLEAFAQTYGETMAKSPLATEFSVLTLKENLGDHATVGQIREFLQQLKSFHAFTKTLSPGSRSPGNAPAKAA